MRMKPVILAFLLVLFTLPAQAGYRAYKGPTVEPPPALAAGSVYMDITIDRIKRRYALHAPAAATTTPLPLIIALHGAGANAARFEKTSGLSQLGEGEHFIALYPEGIKNRWRKDDDSDVAFIRAVVADAATKTNIDKTRIYVTGFSNGAQMAWRMACRAPDLVAALAPVAGSYPAFSDCVKNTKMPALIFHGLEDNKLLYEGKNGDDGPRALAVRLATGNGCDKRPVLSHPADDDGMTGETWGNCKAPITLYTIAGLDHAWPRADTSAQIWAFFKNYSR